MVGFDDGVAQAGGLGDDDLRGAHLCFGFLSLQGFISGDTGFGFGLAGFGTLANPFQFGS